MTGARVLVGVDVAQGRDRTVRAIMQRQPDGTLVMVSCEAFDTRRCAETMPGPARCILDAGHDGACVFSWRADHG